MNAEYLYRSINKTVAVYQTKLAVATAEDFVLTPPIGGWSLSEVYSHIFDSSLLSLMAINSTIQGEGKERPTHFAVKLILFFGMLPPLKKYQVPDRLMQRVKKINCLSAQQFIIDFELQLAKIFPNLKKANPKLKVKHPRMGYLNAMQWLRFIEIHLKHHLKQIDRIEKSFQEAR